MIRVRIIRLVLAICCLLGLSIGAAAAQSDQFFIGQAVDELFHGDLTIGHGSKFQFVGPFSNRHSLLPLPKGEARDYTNL